MSFLKWFKKKVPAKTSIPAIVPDFADISHWEKINFKLYEPKVLITKATEGLNYVDPTFRNIKAECKIREIKFGAYHFFRCNVSPINQARHYLSTVKDFDMAPILDIESLDGVAPTEVKHLIKAWLDIVELETGRIPMIYSGHSFIVSAKFPEEFSRYPLWLARYTDIVPIAPAPWKEWDIWQFSDKAPFKGIGPADGNVFKKK